MPPRHTQQPAAAESSGEQQELSSFAPRTQRETRLSNAALSRQRLKMSLKRGGPPPAASSGAAQMMTTSLSATSLDQQVRLTQPSVCACVCLCVFVWETVARNVRRVLLPHNNLTIELEYCAYDACCQEISLYAALSGVLFTRSGSALELLEFSVPQTHTNTHMHTVAHTDCQI